MAKTQRMGSDPLSWIKDSRPSKRSKPTPQDKPAEAGTARHKLPRGWIRGTFILREEYLEQTKAVAFWDRLEIKQVVDTALGDYLKTKATVMDQALKAYRERPHGKTKQKEVAT